MVLVLCNLSNTSERENHLLNLDAYARSDAITSVSGIRLNCYNSSVLTTSRLRIYDSPSKGTLLATATADFTGPACSGGWGIQTSFTGYFNSLNVLADTQYFLELQRLTGSGNFYFAEASGNPYAGGSADHGGVINSSYDLAVTINMETGDTLAPSFPSTDTFNVSENTTSVGSITTSESATITIFGGDDQSKFTFSKTGDSSTALSFVNAPNFESPTDTGANNTYVIVSVASKITFTLNGKVLPGCKNRATTGSGSSHAAACTWKPARRGHLTLTAASTPAGAGITSAMAPQI